MSRTPTPQTFAVDRAWGRRRFWIALELWVTMIAAAILAWPDAHWLIFPCILVHSVLFSLILQFSIARTVDGYTLEENALVIDYGARTRRVFFTDIDKAFVTFGPTAACLLSLKVGREVLKLPLNGAQHDALVRGVRARLGPGVASPELMQFAGLPSKGFWVAPPDLDALAAQVKEGRGG